MHALQEQHVDVDSGMSHDSRTFRRGCWSLGVLIHVEQELDPGHVCGRDPWLVGFEVLPFLEIVLSDAEHVCPDCDDPAGRSIELDFWLRCGRQNGAKWRSSQSVQRPSTHQPTGTHLDAVVCPSS